MAPLPSSPRFRLGIGLISREKETRKELAPNVRFHIDEEPPRHERFLKRKGYSPGKVPAPPPSKRKR